jgi:hypothetical protein
VACQRHVSTGNHPSVGGRLSPTQSPFRHPALGALSTRHGHRGDRAATPSLSVASLVNHLTFLGRGTRYRPDNLRNFQKNPVPKEIPFSGFDRCARARDIGVEEGYGARRDRRVRGNARGGGRANGNWQALGLVGVPGPAPVGSATPPISLTAINETVLALAIFRQLAGHPLRCVRRHRFRAPVRPG